VLSWMVGNSGRCEMRDDSGWVPSGAERGRINGQRCGEPRHLLGVQQERGGQVRNIEEGEQGESVLPVSYPRCHGLCILLGQSMSCRPMHIIYRKRSAWHV